MSLNVCVECGARVRRLIRKLQFDNYCLEKCVKTYSPSYNTMMYVA